MLLWITFTPSVFGCKVTAVIPKSKLFPLLILILKLGTFYPTTDDYNEKKCVIVSDIFISYCQTEKWSKVISLVLGTQKHLEKC